MKSFDSKNPRFSSMTCILVTLVRISGVLVAYGAGHPATASEIVLYDNLDLAGPGVIQGHVLPTGPDRLLAQPFFTGIADNVSSVTLKLNRNSSPLTGSIAIEIWDDIGSGRPGKSVGTLGTINVGTLTSSYDLYTVEGEVASLKPDSRYYVVIVTANAAISLSSSFNTATVNRADGTGDAGRYMGWRRTELGWEILANVLSEPETSYLRMKVTAVKLMGQSLAPHAPHPADEATDVYRDAVLSWKPGESESPVFTRIVYFSENFDDVKNGIGGFELSTNSYEPGRLDFGQTYYWRIIQINGAPDYELVRGDVWSFTTESIAYPVTNVRATASSTFGGPDASPDRTVDGSGLTDDLHSTQAADMWVSADLPAWIQFEFDQPYKLEELWIWNGNQELDSASGFGAKDVVIEHSLNGADWAVLEGIKELVQAPGAEGYAANNVIDFGGAFAQFVRLSINSVHGLGTRASLSEVRFLYRPTLARAPQPADGATSSSLDIVLSWYPGREAAIHDVIFSGDVNTVLNDSALIATTLDASFDLAGQDLRYGTTYFWKINEVNDLEIPTVHAGNIWYFTTPDFFSVDDMEAYKDEASLEIGNNWIDGVDDPTNGATVGIESDSERNLVHEGDQSMSLVYENYGTVSETTRTFTPPADWSRGAPEVLSLFFLGQSQTVGRALLNHPTALYVVITDSAGEMAHVIHPDPAATQINEWTEWQIPFTNLGALDLSSIASLTLGIGGDGSDGKGKVYFDSIRVGIQYLSAN